MLRGAVPVAASRSALRRSRRKRVNYYRRFPGDYARDTGHLSLAEHGAYALLLDAYYSTERPLPVSNQKLHRICHANNAKERSIVDSVIAEFWTLTDEGFINARGEKELTGQRDRIRAAQNNGKKGGRPPKTQTKPTGLDNQNPDLTQPQSYPDPTPDDLSLRSRSLMDDPPPKKEKTGVYSPAFETAWKAYPKRAGGNPKVKAWKAWKARLAEGVSEQELADSVGGYAAFCETTGKAGTEFVMQSATYFGPDQNYAEDWAVETESWKQNRGKHNGRTWETPFERLTRLNADPPEQDHATPRAAGARTIDGDAETLDETIENLWR